MGPYSVNSMDDCFDFMSEPEYGFRTNVTVMQMCTDPQDNSTCKEIPNQCEGNSCNEGTGGFSEMEETFFKFRKSRYRRSWTDENIISENTIDRQTGEDFSSDGPPECRPINVC